MQNRKRSANTISRMAARGFRGFPIATINFYGPDNTRASKVAVGIIMRQDESPFAIDRWFSDSIDVRQDPEIDDAILEFIKAYEVKSIALSDQIIGCPHEAGTDYPEGKSCPECPFWANRERFTHQKIR